MQTLIYTYSTPKTRQELSNIMQLLITLTSVEYVRTNYERLYNLIQKWYAPLLIKFTKLFGVNAIRQHFDFVSSFVCTKTREALKNKKKYIQITPEENEEIENRFLYHTIQNKQNWIITFNSDKYSGYILTK